MNWNLGLYVFLFIFLSILFVFYNLRDIFCYYNSTSHSQNYSSEKLCSPYRIPKIIHQIWLGPKPVPYQWINGVKEYASRHGYQHILWRDEDLANFKMINQKLFNSEPSWPGKADIARYEILYRYGGIYVDADSMIINGETNKLDQIFQSVETDSFAVYERNNSCLISNGVIGSIKNSKFMKKVIDHIHKYYPHLSLSYLDF